VRLPRLVAVPLLVLALASCGTGTVAADDVAEQAEVALEGQLGTRYEISCPDDLPAEVGATTRCTLAADEDTELGVDITVTEVEGDTVNFDIQVEEDAGA
jgi:hypothetical protein